jgi:hypothetical protein
MTPDVPFTDNQEGSLEVTAGTMLEPIETSRNKLKPAVNITSIQKKKKTKYSPPQVIH